jgi:hypothetical protein
MAASVCRDQFRICDNNDDDTFQGAVIIADLYPLREQLGGILRDPVF